MSLHDLASWFETSKRDLPWRQPDAGPWGVLVSEIMLQQTPVNRVLPVWEEWMARWPDPAALASSTVADAVTAWGRLGYPRRAKRLHDIAVVLVEQHHGHVPQGLEELLALPGVGHYTARAIRCFAFEIPEPVVDTNVRRVVARAVFGSAHPGPPRDTDDRRNVAAILHTLDSDSLKCSISAALMELGAVVCKARNPVCSECPLFDACEWRKAGYPAYAGPPVVTQPKYEGSDRQVRGIILRELRASDVPIPDAFLSSLWPDRQQYRRALMSLILDGLIRETAENSREFELPRG